MYDFLNKAFTNKIDLRLPGQLRIDNNTQTVTVTSANITKDLITKYNRSEEARETLLGLQYGYYFYSTYMYLSGCSLMLSTQYCQQTGVYKITWYHLHARIISPPSFV